MPVVGKSSKPPSDITPESAQAAEKKTKWAPFTKKFGATVRDAGIAVVPRVLLTGLADLKLKPIECVVLLQLIACWGGTGHPYPKRKTLRDWLGCDKRTLDRAIKGLVEKKLVAKGVRMRRGRRTSNEYDLTGLVEQLKPLGKRAINERKKREALRTAAEMS